MQSDTTAQVLARIGLEASCFVAATIAVGYLVGVADARPLFIASSICFASVATVASTKAYDK